MLIPVRCLSCGNVIGNKYNYYKAEVAKEKQNLTTNSLSTININSKEIRKTIEGRILDDLNITKECCRIVMMTHIEY